MFFGCYGVVMMEFCCHGDRQTSGFCIVFYAAFQPHRQKNLVAIINLLLIDYGNKNKNFVNIFFDYYLKQLCKLVSNL